VIWFDDFAPDFSPRPASITRIVDMGMGGAFFAAPADPSLVAKIKAKAEEAFKTELSVVTAFVRKDTPASTNQMRIHADGRFGKELPTVAAVLYSKTDGTGTGFFEHKTYGDTHVPGQNPEIVVRDHKKQWQLVDYVDAKKGRLLLYPSNRYHGRQPWRVTKDRVVLVVFMKEKI
jgi:hypothetical protein